jgi:hypothetical protein
MTWGMKMREMPDDNEVEALFAEARSERPPAGLVARVLADAEAAQPERVGLGAALLRAIGGWPSAAGLAAACGVGLLIGYSAPTTLPFLAPATTATAEATYDLIDFTPGYGVQSAFEG